jgi:hypothetical protein
LSTSVTFVTVVTGDATALGAGKGRNIVCVNLPASVIVSPAVAGCVERTVTVNVALRPVVESVTVTVPDALTSPVVRLLPLTVPIVALLSVIVSGPGVTDPPPLAVSVALSV